MKYIKGFDTIRTGAIIFVIITHWGPHGSKSPLLNFIFSKLIPDGKFGVDLFFVLSGYLITKILLAARKQGLKNERMKILKNFYVRRALRIFPIYFLYVFIMIYVLHDDYVKKNIVFFLTYTTNFLAFREGQKFVPHVWSLAVEEQFYLIWPWVIIFAPKRILFSLIVGFILIGLCSSLILQHFFGEYVIFLLLPCITAFSIGALYAYVEISRQFYNITVNCFKVLFPVCIILLFLHQFGHHFVLIRAINSIIGVVVIMYISRQDYNRFTAYIFNNKILVNIGKISYGIYLYHFGFPFYYNQFISYLQQNNYIDSKTMNVLTTLPPAYFIYLASILLIATLSYKFIELPFLKLKSYFNYTDTKNIQKNISLIK
ncbi:MAG TPA: acyltransferase [Mucilaginibacter sp.]|jgi:peptidoglycan/LPS O-acetylase OafA/YrhL